MWLVLTVLVFMIVWLAVMLRRAILFKHEHVGSLSQGKRPPSSWLSITAAFVIIVVLVAKLWLMLGEGV